MMEETEETVNQRLILIVEAFDKGVKSVFAQKIGISPQGAHDLLSGRKGSPSFKALTGILKAYPTISADWLLLGQGPMLREQAHTPAPPAVELVQLIQEYIQITNRLDGIKATVRELGRNQKLFKDDVERTQAVLDTIKETQSTIVNQDKRQTVSELLERCQQMFEKAQERYNNFLPLCDKAEHELISALNYQGQLEKRLGQLISSSVPLTVEEQLYGISARTQLVQAVNSPSRQIL